MQPVPQTDRIIGPCSDIPMKFTTHIPSKEQRTLGNSDCNILVIMYKRFINRGKRAQIRGLRTDVSIIHEI